MLVHVLLSCMLLITLNLTGAWDAQGPPLYDQPLSTPREWIAPLAYSWASTESHKDTHDTGMG